LLGDLPGVPSGGGFEGIDFSSPELINFLASRANDLATLVLVGANDTNRELQFVPREVTGFEPTLEINAAHAAATAVPEPATWIMLMLGMAAIMFTGSRKFVSNSTLRETL
ncbi:MAG: PEP-CTERM sorting domain-containing protein, partial [Pirellulales bacterium]